MVDVIERQQIETKNTISFLKYVLAKRDDKTAVYQQQTTSLFTSKMSSPMSQKRR